MRFTRTETAEEIAGAATAMLAGEWRLTALRTAPTAIPIPLWAKAASMGWFSLLVPEDRGGLGLGLLEATAVAEATGHALMPGPVVETMTARGLLGALDGLPDDAVVAAPASTGRNVASGPSGLRGDLDVVPFADSADIIVVPAESSGEPVVALVDRSAPGVQVRPLRSIDPAHRPCTVLLRDATPRWTVVGPDAAALLDALRDTALVLTSARLLGVLDRVLALTVAYANLRVQFGRPIADFQTVQHRLADMAAAAIVARSVTDRAAWELFTAGPEQGRRAAVAKAYVSRSARGVVESALQVHGGIGFTEEHDLQLYFKHALTLQGQWGDETVHQDALAQLALERSA